MCFHHCVRFVSTAVLLLTLHAIGQAAEVDYQRDVQPILAEHCTACHGVDEESRESGLRLDMRDAALKSGDSGLAAIVPGKPEDSELWKRITSADSDVLMPPADHDNPLSRKQIDTIRQWIIEGAAFSDHWAFVVPRQKPIPSDGPLHPVDAFVAERLRLSNLPSADRESPWVLCRRLYLDVTGLPPSPEDLTAFERDGLDATLEKLLASERFGEKWARPWLDAARYSDTNGYEKDMQRDQWAWRDWVINSLNADMPYDQFIIEQIAGDLLPDSTQDQMIATGFLRNSMINEEGAIVPEQFRMVEMFDRIDCIGKSVLGLSTQCAQCHTHKFDPFTMDEYYGMFAFLNNSYEAQSWVYSAEQQAKRDEVLAGLRRLEDQIRTEHAAWSDQIQAWAQHLATTQPVWQPITFHDMNSISGLNHPTQEHDGSLLMKGHVSGDVYMIGEPQLKGVTGLQLEMLNHSDLPFRGPGRSKVGTWGVREVEVFLQLPGSDAWEKQKLIHATADFSEPERKLDEDKNTSGPVSLLIDGADNTWWKADRGIGRRNAPSVAVMQFEAPLNAPAGTQFKIAMRMTDMAGCCRFSLTNSTAPAAAPIDYDAVLAATTPADQRSIDQHAALFTAWRKTVPDLQPINDQIAALWNQYPRALTSVLHVAERDPFNHRSTHLLSRGSWDQPQQVIEPHVPAAFHPLPATEEPPRLRFARWLVDRQSPLAARVAVNRVWQSIFGAGLVETSEDFGTRAPVPEYRDILDWLAVDFMDHNWSTRHLIRRIVTSRTYQQSSKVSQGVMEADPANRLLTRGPRFRADAEVIRDMAMAISGLIHQKLGGPGVIPPVPQNVLDYNYVYPAYWKPAEVPERYRRTVYGFRKRSMPDPAMSTLDAPNADSACARRIRSNTPLAALTGLNEPIFVESAQALALRILREGGPDDTSRIRYAYILCMARHPTGAETQTVLDLLAAHRQRIADGWLNAREVATGKPDQLPDLPNNATPQDAAAWTLTARALLNLDETMSKN
jgi:mono/diheme cytochrome c family protein